jgi:predicted chitinase
MIDDNEFQAMRLDAEAVFAALYLIDQSVLSEQQHEEQQRAMAAAYLALVNIESAKFGKLNNSVKHQLKEVASALKTLQKGVRQLPTPHEKLAFVAEGLGTLATVAKVLQQA